LANACARHGLAFGVYYSTIDWHHPGGNTYLPGNSNPITPSQEAFNVAQVKELLGNYGPISEIWFDMGKPTPAQSAHFARQSGSRQAAARSQRSTELLSKAAELGTLRILADLGHIADVG
jgi:alpha-L-fucosidase